MPPAPSAGAGPATSTSAGAALSAGYLGPEGTFSEEALLGSAAAGAVTPVALETIRDAVMAVQERTVEWSLVPIENSIEGSVTVTLDTLAGEAGEVAIVGEVVLPVRHYLIAATPLELERIETVVSHPHVPGQCTRFLHGPLASARVLAASSTAEAVRLVSERKDNSLAAIGTRLASELYECVVIAEGIQDREDNETRFVWLARVDSGSGAPPLRTKADNGHKTSLVFWGAGADHAGWLVLCLNEFAQREINLTKIESRPMREQLGHYMFFVDLEGSLQDEVVAQALAGLRAMCEQVRVFGSYPAA
ncbi:MAG TPA: prephenate dehydratase [Solirubrobacteraceae bacterium]|jgi:prephenate dehydratase|nr:prephenate dehydratase [Solirubrobacteraceae bacterium]